MTVEIWLAFFRYLDVDVSFCKVDGRSKSAKTVHLDASAVYSEKYEIGEKTQAGDTIIVDSAIILNLKFFQLMLQSRNVSNASREMFQSNSDDKNRTDPSFPIHVPFSRRLSNVIEWWILVRSKSSRCTPSRFNALSCETVGLSKDCER